MVLASALVAAAGCQSSGKSSSTAGDASTTSTAKKFVSGSAQEIVGSPDALTTSPGAIGAGTPGAVGGAAASTGPGALGTTGGAGAPGSPGSTPAPPVCGGPGQPATPTPPTTTGAGTPLAARADLVLTTKGTPVVVAALANDTHPPAHTLTVDAPSAPRHGKASVVGGGRLLRYEPAPSFTGEDSFSYAAVDGADRSSAKVTVRVQASAPPAFGSPLRVESGSCTTVLAPARLPSQTFVVAGVTPGAHGGLVVDPEGARVDYSPAAGYHGSDAFSATLSDGGPNPSYFTLAIIVP